LNALASEGYLTKTPPPLLLLYMYAHTLLQEMEYNNKPLREKRKIWINFFRCMSNITEHTTMKLRGLHFTRTPGNPSIDHCSNSVHIENGKIVLRKVNLRQVLWNLDFY